MSDSKKPTLSEIREWWKTMGNGKSTTDAVIRGMEAEKDIPYLLDLVERMGKEIGQWVCPGCEHWVGCSPANCAFCKEARALLKEIEK